VIGRKGAVAKTIFTAIKGKIKVSDTPIPHTTDKAAYMTGTPEQMKKIMDLVLRHLVDKLPKREFPMRNYIPEGRISYRYEQHNWPNPRDVSPPRDWRGYSPPPRRYDYDDRERDYDRYDPRGPPGDRYSERPSRPPFEDGYGPRDPYDRYDPRDASPSRDEYYPRDPYGPPPYRAHSEAYASTAAYRAADPYTKAQDASSGSYSSPYPERGEVAPAAVPQSPAAPSFSTILDPFARLDALDRRAPRPSYVAPGGYGTKQEPSGPPPGVKAAMYANPRPSRPAGLDSRPSPYGSGPRPTR